MVKEAERMRAITGRLFDDITENIMYPHSISQENPEEIIQKNFEKKYFEPQRRRPSSAKTGLEEALYQNKMEEIRSDLEQFDREYGFNYQNYLEGQNVKKEDIEKMTNFLIKKYGISHKAGDLYIKEFIDTFSENERKDILKDYEQSIISNVSFYITKLSRGISTRNLAPRLLGRGTDDQKKELFIRTLIETNTLTPNFGLFNNEDFREYLFQKFCKENNIKLDNPKTVLEVITPVRYPYGARRKITYRKPTPPISPASISSSSASPSSNEGGDTRRLRFGEPSLPSVIEETTPNPTPTPPPIQSSSVRPRTKRELEEMKAIAMREPILPPPPPPQPRKRTSAPKRPSIPKKK